MFIVERNQPFHLEKVESFLLSIDLFVNSKWVISCAKYHILLCLVHTQSSPIYNINMRVPCVCHCACLYFPRYQERLVLAPCCLYCTNVESFTWWVTTTVSRVQTMNGPTICGPHRTMYSSHRRSSRTLLGTADEGEGRRRGGRGEGEGELKGRERGGGGGRKGEESWRESWRGREGRGKGRGGDGKGKVVLPCHNCSPPPHKSMFYTNIYTHKSD